ncbi:MAG: YihY/virulence factor BrkB family protein [Thermoleophilia bacterium]|nr:YihY/virulence factor BrkB family protein [Thermoleophilia bacterium]
MLDRTTAISRVRGLPFSLLTDSAAALTYYTVLSIFPGLALMVAVVSLIAGDGMADSVIEVIREVAPESVTETLTEPLDSMAADTRMNGVVLVLSMALALFSASRYVAAFGRSTDRIQGRQPGPGLFWRRRRLAMLVVGAMIILLPLALLALLVTGPVAVAVAREIGLSSNGRELFEILRWPLMGLVGISMLTILYLSSEEMRRAGIRRVLPGALVAIAGWLVASGLFSIFVANLTSFSLIYGSLAGLVVFLIWLYVSNLAVLAGMVVNAVRLGTLATPDPAGSDRSDRGGRA